MATLSEPNFWISSQVSGAIEPIHHQQIQRRNHLIQEFDRGIRGIVRIAQGISRLAGREDLGQRFRPILRRTLRQLDEQASEEGDAPESGETSAEGAEPSQPSAAVESEELVSQETSA